MAAEHFPSAHPPTSAGGRAWAVAPATAWTHTEGGDVVVMPLASGIPLRVSATGSVVWDVLVGGRTPEDDLAADPPTPVSEAALTAEVAAAFGLGPAEVSEGVRDFLSLLERHGVLERR